MPMSATDWSRLMGRRAASLDRQLDRRIVRAATVIRDQYVGRVTRVTRDGRLSGARNARVTARWRWTAPHTVIVAARGPAHLIERPTSPHLITSRRGGGRAARARRLGGAAWSRRSGAAMLPIGPVYGRGRVQGAIHMRGIGWRAWARHPGTRGKWPWRDALRASRGRAQRILTVGWVDDLRRVR